ncbi:MAG: amidohydrolase family protein [Planctomycetia bacterium]|nr:amidohydrolase family protein [Planctomycetia bacterium]
MSQPTHAPLVCLISLVISVLLGPRGAPILRAAEASRARFDTVIEGGRVIDPASGLDAVRNVGIADGSIKAITAEKLDGAARIDARGLVVAPGFIDLHSHGQDDENYRCKAMDGVTTALELEIGTGDVDAWYAAREGKSLVHFGVSSGHLPARSRVFGETGSGSLVPAGDAAHNPATDAQIHQMRQLVEAGLDRGALAVGLGIQYVPNASRWEILEMFRAAAKHGAPCHVHIRNAGEKEPHSSVQALEEVIAAATITGAPLHVVHVSSSGLRGTPRLLTMIGEARSRGLDITTECYPYTASMTPIQSAIFDEGWQEVLGVDYPDLQWTATGERLTAESFARYRKTGGMVVIHSMSEAIVVAAVTSPLTMIASDGRLERGKGHPRSAGTFARVLGRYVREGKQLSLTEALRKMTIAPAERLERRAPMVKNKGRLAVEADADVVVFDPAKIIDQATYEEPARYSTGIQHVLVSGVSVVRDGQLLSDAAPGRPVRAPVR